MGYSVGLLRAGGWGGLAAWVGFTLPSAVAMVCFALGARTLTGAAGEGLVHGLTLVAVPIVGQAVIGMGRTLCPDLRRALIAVVSALIALAAPGSIAQLLTIAFGAAAGAYLCRGSVPTAPWTVTSPVSQRAGLAALTMFFALLLALPVARAISHSSLVALADAFYRSGALVFGGGHVVLPLLREALVSPGWVDERAFLAGYGAAQALPGPLFSVAGYLGAVALPAAHGWAGAALGLVSIFVPGLLLVTGALPFWSRFRSHPRAEATLRGVNAAVVGVLGAALYDPVWTNSVRSAADIGIVLVGFALLMVWRAPPLLVCAVCALGGLLLR